MKTDAELQQDVMAELKWEPSVNASKIGIEVTGSDVILSGTVHSWAERNVARHSAGCAPGVHKVVDNITLAY